PVGMHSMHMISRQVPCREEHASHLAGYHVLNHAAGRLKLFSHDKGIAVFNFEVTGDHTYFVEDGFGAQTALWVLNTCRGRHHFHPVSWGNGIPYGNKTLRVRSANRTVSSDVLATPNRLQNKLAAWRRYDGDLSLSEWSRKYDQLQMNRLRGSWAESFGEARVRHQTPYG